MIRFLKLLFRRFEGSGLDDKLSIIVQPNESLTRFMFSRDDFAEMKGVVKARAFFPDNRGETSVFRTAKLSHEAIWEIGNKIREESLKARGELLCAVPREIGLRVEAATEDHPRHAVIVGWPAEKHEMKMLTARLSAAATLYVVRLDT